MRILVCDWDFPYPPRGGGRADIWRRIQAFSRLGHEVMLLNQYDPTGHRPPTDEAVAQVDSVVKARFSFPIKRSRTRTARQLLTLARLPWRVATRVPDAAERAAIERQVREFAPDLIWLDGPWFGEIGMRLHRETGAPIAYRSHNVEHVYLGRQAAAAARLRDRIAWRIAAVGLERYQLRLMSEAAMVFDISLDDMEYWRRRGVTNIRWLPPLPELALTEPPVQRTPTDVLFVGGLRTPNNVQGVRWLVERVLPLLLRAMPGLVMGVVGAHPLPELQAELAAIPAVRTFYDVADVTRFQFGARVLVNPVAVGSGVQLKMLDMLMTDAPIVTRSQGLSGLPASCAAQFDVADDEEEFAARVLARLKDGGIDRAARAEVRRQFAVEAVQEALSAIPPPRPD